MDKYYVYALLRPDKPGIYKYENYVFTHLPFYIGKGTGNRIYATTYPYMCAGNMHKCRILNFLANNDLKPISFIIADDLTEHAALLLEEKIIKTIGRGLAGPLVNLTDNGIGTTGHKQIKKQKKIYVFDLIGTFLYEFESTYAASKILHINSSLISRCLHKKTYTTNNYVFRFKHEFENKPEKIDTKYLLNKKGNGPIPRKVKQLDLYGNLIAMYNTIKEAAEKTGCYESKIVQCCKKQRHTHKSYKWEYYED